MLCILLKGTLSAQLFFKVYFVLVYLASRRTRNAKHNEEDILLFQGLGLEIGGHLPVYFLVFNVT